MSGIGPALDPNGSAATPAPAPRETARAPARVVADPAATATPATATAEARAAAPPAPAAEAPTATAPAQGTATAASSAAAPATVDANALPDAMTAPLTPAAPVSAAPATATTTAPAKPVATVQTPPARPVASPAADAGSLGGLVFSLLLIVGLILALGWLARRMPGFGGGAASKTGLRLVASLPVGARERVVVVEVGGTQLLLGVGAGGVRTLHTLDEPLPESATGAPSPFAQVLAQHFGKKA
jgi:flagellar protein FliO/FliZ